MSNTDTRLNLFNSPVEVGLRALVILTDIFPDACTLDRLVILDYFVIHSDDLPEGPLGLHPKTPHRSGEILVRRNTLQAGLMLFQSRGLIEIQYRKNGVCYAAMETSSSFLDAIDAEYVTDLRNRSAWLNSTLGNMPDVELHSVVQSNLGVWGAEFEMESVLHLEDKE
ncbi:hypothetical protein VN12_23500 [Pirellula sp. SH-Sr6A]|uniref:ABC-three component system middle component 2 n=1 Tax=Pirellula sp. SH-Sr6A TaxID=1632865 RepID=UPI00078E1067|nr:ABC-three component system middle component 2 [Pirellula sp. SH-Sr6A]AMV35112.1 hypothetical protein VN12_23500 [Pirellula sp. SH-Sr6A]